MNPLIGLPAADGRPMTAADGWRPFTITVSGMIRHVEGAGEPEDLAALLARIAADAHAQVLEPDDDLAVEVEHVETSTDLDGAEPRVCGYCSQPGHDHLTCALLNADALTGML